MAGNETPRRRLIPEANFDTIHVQVIKFVKGFFFKKIVLKFFLIYP